MVDVMNEVCRQFKVQYGTEWFVPCKSYDYTKKVEVIVAFRAAEAANGGVWPNISALIR